MIQDPDIFRQHEAELRQLTVRLDDLKRQYDNYFVGLEKRQPGLLRARLDRTIRQTKLHTTLSTVLRFKFQQFLARYRTYSANWDRICREIEEGTYRRGSTTAAERLAQKRSESALRRARGVEDSISRETEDLSRDHRRLKDAAKQAEAFLASIVGEPKPLNDKSDASERTGRTKTKHTEGPPSPPKRQTSPLPPRIDTNTPAAMRPTDKTGAPPPAVRTTQPGPPPMVRITDADNPSVSMRPTIPTGGEPQRQPRSTRMADSREGVEALYASYLHARRSQGEDISRVSLSSFTKSVKRQQEKAREKLKSEDVVLKVKIKDGKVKLVASKSKKAT
ncbi:MAG: MXAN_5187 C-terminal domain-containing protein [Myxococcota bacterium]|nr:MXAN_5187 C-terminal domain-containing protein [Myxococcota bacterium]